MKNSGLGSGTMPTAQVYPPPQPSFLNCNGYFYPLWAPKAWVFLLQVMIYRVLPLTKEVLENLYPTVHLPICSTSPKNSVLWVSKGVSSHKFQGRVLPQPLTANESWEFVIQLS